MDSCERYIEMMSARIDGELFEAEEQELSAHLGECAACRELLALMEDTGRAMRGMSVEPPGELRERVMQGIERESGKTPRPRRFAFGRFTAAAAVLALILLAVYAFPNLFGANKSSSVSDTNAEMAPAATVNENEAFAAEAPAAPKTAERTAGEEYGDFGYSAAAPSPAPAPEPTAAAGGSEQPAAGLTGTEAPMMMYSGEAQVTGAPALPYANIFSAILVLHGEIPEALEGYRSETGNETEIYVFVPTEDLGGIITAGNYEVYRDEPNTDPSADTAIVVIYGG